MKKEFSEFLVAPLLMVLTLSCSLFDTDSEPEIDQNILFEFEYVNWAWGYQHSGFYIDKNGAVHSYNYGPSDGQWDPEDREHPTEAELLEKYSHSKSLRQTVDPDSIYYYYKMIDEAAEGPYSDTVNVGADIGAYYFQCYLYSSKTDSYERVVLHLTGDWTFENLSMAAKSIFKWLAQVLNMEKY